MSDFGIGQAAGNIIDAAQGYMNYDLALQKYGDDNRYRQEMMHREDNAVQRRVADLRAAGLSPTLAAGSAASAGPVVSTQAPQLNLGNFKGRLDPSASIQSVMAIKQANAQIAQTEAQTELLKQQKDQNSITNPLSAQSIQLKNHSMDLANQYAEDTLGSRVDLATQKSIAQRLENTFQSDTLSYRTNILRAQLDRQEIGIMNDKLDTALKNLGITHQTLDNTRLSLENQFSSNTFSKREVQLDYDLSAKLLALKIGIYALDTAKSGATSARSRAVQDLLDAQFWLKSGVSPDAAHMSADLVKTIIGHL